MVVGVGCGVRLIGIIAVGVGVVCTVGVEPGAHALANKRSAIHVSHSIADGLLSFNAIIAKPTESIVAHHIPNLLK